VGDVCDGLSLGRDGGVVFDRERGAVFLLFVHESGGIENGNCQFFSLSFSLQ